jgi:hypothetical protein
MGKRLKRRSVAAALLTLAVVATIGAGTANATSPASGNGAPGGGGGGVKGVVTGGGGPSGGVQGQVASGGNGTLPFTGADLGLYGAAGVGMIGAGLLLRRASTRRVS